MFLFESSEDKKIREDSQNQFEICLRSFDEKAQDKYKKSMQFLSKHIQNNNQKVIEMVVDNIKSNIKDDQNKPERKYQAIRLLRDLMKIQIKNKNKSLGKYVVKKIFKRLKILAAYKSESKDQDRGKDIFGKVKGSQEKYSVLFLNQLLLAIQQWGKTWPGTSEGLKKQFSETYKELITSGVQFPKQSIKVAQPSNYKAQDKNRNSVSPYSSVPKRQSLGKNDEKSQLSQLRSSIAEQKPKKQIKKIGGKLDENKVKNYFRDIIPLVEEFIMLFDQMDTPQDPQDLMLFNDMIQPLRDLIANGDSFCAQLSEEQLQTDFYAKKIKTALSYSESVAKDLKKLTRNISQFSKFKSKYTTLGNALIQQLKDGINGKTTSPPKIRQKSPINQQPEVKIPQQSKVAPPSQNNQKSLIVPKVSAPNLYNSNSGQPNNWVIRKGAEYNSNSQRDENEANKQFGSFGIGGIGEKIKVDNQKQKSPFANKSQTERPSQSFENRQSQDGIKQAKTQKQLPSVKEVSQPQSKESKIQTKEVKVAVKDSLDSAYSDKQAQNQKPSQQFYFDEPSATGKQKVKEKHEKTKDMFNDSDFKQQKKVQLSQQEKDPHLEESANFFDDFGDKQKQPAPHVNRNQRRQKTNATNKQINIDNDNPFQTHMKSNLNDSSNNFSAFNQDKPSQIDSQNVVPQNSTSIVNPFQQKNRRNSQQQSVKRKESFNDPFDKSFQINKSNASKNRNSFNDQNPNFWETSGDRSKDNKRNSQTQRQSQNMNQSSTKRQKVQNPFESVQFQKRNNSINPFQDDNKSQGSQKNKSSVLNFEINRSFTKSQRSNPFQTTSNNDNKTSSKQQKTNPFEQTQKEDFRPRPPKKYDSVSQQNSFKKVEMPDDLRKDTSMDNPFQTKTEGPSMIKQQDQGLNFDQFQNIPGPRDSINTSQFPKVITQIRQPSPIPQNRISFARPQQSEREKSIRFSQFGDPNESVVNRQRQESKKSFNFDDFDNVPSKPRNEADQFSGFEGFQQKSKVKASKKQNQFDAFEVSKTSKNDFFRQTSKNDQSKNGFFRETQKQQKSKEQDSKSKHSGFSGFNLNLDNKSEEKNNQSGVNWDDFGQFNKGRQTDKARQPNNIKFDDTEMRFSETKKLQINNNNQFNLKNGGDTQRQQYQSKKNFIDRNDLKLNFSQTTSKYQSPQFNQKYEQTSPSNDKAFEMANSIKSVQNQRKQDRSSVKFQQFGPIEKRGYDWNPLGISVEKFSSKVYNVQDYDIDQKKKEQAYYKTIYEKEKQLLQKAKQLYNQARKVYLQKIQKIDAVLQQKQSYKKILLALKQSNSNKENQIFNLNEKIKQLTIVKEKILQKEKLLFDKTKAMEEADEMRNNNYRPNINKWEIFNRNLKMMRQRNNQDNFRYSSQNYSRTPYNYSQNY